jgi:hypothetical protein
MITSGVSDICGVEKKREIENLPSSITTKHGVVDLMIGTKSNSMVSYQRYMG